MLEMMQTICEETFTSNIEPSLSELNSCMTTHNRPGRTKRSLLELVYRAGTVICAVVNFVKGYSSPTDENNTTSMLSELNHSLLGNIEQLLANKELKADVTSAALKTVSQSTHLHPYETRDASLQYKDFVFYLSHVFNELYAGKALIQAITKECKKGQLASKEIGELIESDYLYSLEPNDTVLYSVKAKDFHIDLTYSILDQSVAEETSATTYALYAILLSIIITILSLTNLIYVTIKLLRKKDNNPETNTETSSDDETKSYIEVKKQVISILNGKTRIIDSTCGSLANTDSTSACASSASTNSELI